MGIFELPQSKIFDSPLLKAGAEAASPLGAVNNNLPLCLPELREPAGDRLPGEKMLAFL